MCEDAPEVPHIRWIESRKKMSLPVEAISLLKAAADSERGMIMHGKHLEGETIHTNGNTYTDGANPRILAVWRHALERLLGAGFVTRLGSGTVLQVTKRGYDFVETLEKVETSDKEVA